MAIFHSCCLCCNLRTGAFISGIYTCVSSIFYLVLVVIRNVGYNVVEKQGVHASLTYGSIACLSLFILGSVLLIIAVPTDSLLLYGLWLIMAPITILYSSAHIVYTVVYNLQNDLDIEGWEQALIAVHVVNTIITVICIACVYSQFYDLWQGKGSAAYYGEMEMARQHAIAMMLGFDMGGGMDDMMVAPVQPLGPLTPPSYVGAPPPAYSDLSSRRQQQQSTRGGADSNHQNETRNGTSGVMSNGTAVPVSNPPSESNTPVGTERSVDSSSVRPRPSARPPPSELTVSGDSAGGPSSVVYLNFEESEDGLSTFSSPMTLIREQAVARVTVGNRDRDGDSGATAADSESQSGAQENNASEENNNSQGANNGSQPTAADSSSRPQESSARGSDGRPAPNPDTSASEQSRARVRRAREGFTREGSSNNVSSQEQSNNNRPARRENNSSRRGNTPQAEQPGRSSRRNISDSATELPPPYQTHDPNRRPIVRNELEAQAYAHAQMQAQMHAHAQAHAQSQFLMRQHSRGRDPGWMEPQPHPGMNPYFGAATYM